MFPADAPKEQLVNFWLQQPRELQTAVVAVLAALLAGQVNRGIYRLAWSPRQIGPWSAPVADAPARRWYDRLPIVGWIGLARETPFHGKGYWLRPIVVELGLALGLAWLYWSIVHHRVDGLLALGIPVEQTIALLLFLRLATLLLPLTIATFIDLDEKTIPDEVTVPGTLAGLLWSWLVPGSALPVIAATQQTPLLATSPGKWAPQLDSATGLLVGLACVGCWCWALLPKTWTTRHGWWRAFRYLWASSLRTPWFWRYGLIGCGASAIVVVAWLQGHERWQGLLTALLGMAFGGGLVWTVRIVAGGVLQKEAMGFGDVTLMAMIGAFLGWQPSLIVFFMAPFAALFVALVQWILTRNREIAFGPYLSVAALWLIVRWDAIWEQAGGSFALGWRIPLIIGFCFVAMAAMLWTWRAIEGAWHRTAEPENS
ncbi:MAG: prepilin peptidase [Planctomycetes bacterium]|nr:prepilin peptidase [Planctomycetota bacterium]